jgi:hypothetical protein
MHLSSDNEINVGDVKIKVHAPCTEALVPEGFSSKWGLDFESGEVVSHLRWMAQKVGMGQDMFLLGPPSPLRRHLVLTFAELAGYECEFLTITRDTTESDLKQRRDIIGNTLVFTDQAPVRAALNGRLLVYYYIPRHSPDSP